MWGGGLAAPRGALSKAARHSKAKKKTPGSGGGASGSAAAAPAAAAPAGALSPIRQPEVVHSASVRIAIRTGAGGGGGGGGDRGSPDSMAAASTSTNVSTAISTAHQFHTPQADDADGGDGESQTGSVRLNFVSPHQHSILSALVDSGESAAASIIDNPVMVVRILNEIDIDSLHRAVQALIERHPTLRTAFGLTNAAPPSAAFKPTDGIATPTSGSTPELSRFFQEIFDAESASHTNPNASIKADFRTLDCAALDQSQVQQQIFTACHTAFSLDSHSLFRVRLLSNIRDSQSSRPASNSAASTPSLASSSSVASLSSLATSASSNSLAANGSTNNLSALASTSGAPPPPALSTAASRDEKSDSNASPNKGSTASGGGTMTRTASSVAMQAMIQNNHTAAVAAKASQPLYSVLIMACSPIVADVWSICTLLDDLRVLYQSSHAATQFALPALDLDYSTYSQWQYDQLMKDQNANALSAAGGAATTVAPLPLSAAGATAAAAPIPVVNREGDQLWSFWQQQLSGHLPQLSLSMETPHGDSGRGESLCSYATMKVPADITSALKKLVEREGTMLYTVLLASFQAFLFRYTNADDICIGSRMSCRGEPEAEHVVGPFSNTVVFRSAALKSNPAFRSHLANTRQAVINVKAHSDYPYPLLLQKLKHKNEANNHTDSATAAAAAKLFNVMFEFEYPESSHASQLSDTVLGLVASVAIGIEGPAARVGGLHMQPIDTPASWNSVHDLSVKMCEVEGSLVGKWTYDASIFKPEMITRMTQHFVTILESIVSDPDQNLSDLPLISKPEQKLLLHTWNNTGAVYPNREQLVHHAVQEQALRTPHGLAVVHGDNKLTYEQLNSQANQLAHYLRFLGVTPEMPVPILLQRTPNFIIAILAVLKSGGCCMPLDPSYPQTRVQFMIEQAESRVCITDNHLKGNLPDMKELRVLNLDVERDMIKKSGNTSNLLDEGLPDHLAYVLYTSGSTGAPKGVMLAHRGLINYMNWHIHYYGMTAPDGSTTAASAASAGAAAAVTGTAQAGTSPGGDRMAHIASMAFDASMAETWPTLAVGATLVQPTDDDVRVNPPKLVAWMQSQRVTMAFLTTQLGETFLDQTYPKDFSLRVLFTGGDKLHKGAKIDAGFTLVNIYGPTETTVNATLTRVANGTTSAPPIGRPVPNVQIYIVDPYMHPVPIGVYGELYIGGVQLARGYFKRPDLTKERFVPNPFSSDPLSRLYKTGDLVRYTSDGNVEFLGRADTQVKIRGFRIELSEIEAALLSLSFITETCVIAREDKPNDKRLVAYVVLRENASALAAAAAAAATTSAPAGGKDSKSETKAAPAPAAGATDWKNHDHVSTALKRALKEKVPPYMVPQAFVILEKLPLTSNGKINRSILPAPKLEDLSHETYIAPASKIEVAIAQLCADLLGLERVGMSDNFFEIGGHSLSAAQLLTRIRDMFGVEFALSNIFNCVNFRELSSVLSSMIADRPLPPAVAELVVPTPAAPALTPAAAQSAAADRKGDSKSAPAPSASASAASAAPAVNRQLSTASATKAANAAAAAAKLERDLKRDAERHAKIAAEVEAKIKHLPPVITGAKYKLTYNQKSLWFLSGLDPLGWSSLAYNIPFACKFNDSAAGAGAVQFDALIQAFQLLVARHSALRTTFPDAAIATPAPAAGGAPATGAAAKSVTPTAAAASGIADENSGEPVQVIGDNTQPQKLDLERVSMDPKTTSDAALKKWMHDFTYKPFDLARGPLMRVRLITRGEQRFMIWTVHHIAVDLWSFVVLLDDLGAIYSQITKQRPLYPLSPTPMQYVQCLPSQEATVTGVSGEKLWHFWQTALVEPLPVLQLPTDRPRLPKQTFKGASHLADIQPSLLIQLRALARAEGVTLYTLLLSAFYTLLHHYTQQEDIIVGSPMACRNDIEREDCVGYYVNPIPLRSDLAGNPPFKTYLASVRRMVMNALVHSGLPFPLLVSKLGTAPDPSRSPLFQVMFVLQKPHRSHLADPGLAMFFVNNPGFNVRLANSGLDLESMDIGQSHSQFDLTLMCAESAHNLVASFQYNTDLFDASTIDSMAKHYDTLLRSIVANPNQHLASLNLLPAPERALIMDTFNGHTQDFPTDKTIVQLIEEQVRRAPERLALVANEEKYTYQQLNDDANRLAHYLRFLGVGVESPVVVFMRRQPLFVLSELAVLKADGTYMPIDISYPKARAEYMMEVADCRLIITESAVLDKLPTPTKQQRVLLIDKEWPFIHATGNPRNLPHITTPLSLATIIFTSGSTGKPKGVMLPNTGIINYAVWHWRRTGMTAADRHTHLATVTFDGSLLETWPTLMIGAAIVFVMDDADKLDPSRFVSWAAKAQVTMAWLPTVLAESVLAVPYPDNFAMRVITCGGDKCHRGPRPDAKFRFFSIYGPCECTIAMTCFELTPTTVAPPFVLGHPEPNVTVYILDQHMQLLPIGVIGEMYIGGVQLARGYYRRPDATKASFVPNPFSSDPNSRLYKTGDLGRYLRDGQLEFFGRKDGQVKIRGNRIELGEIEAALLDHAAIKEVCVIARQDPLPGQKVPEKRLVAYYVRKDSKAPELPIAELRALIRSKLPEFMVPSAFVHLDALPLTPNAKINRDALPAPKADTSGGTNVHLAPRNPIEEVLSKIAAEVLALERVGMSDNFFDIGGHSLAAAQLLSRIRQQLGVDLPLSRIFDTPTLGGLAEAIAVIRSAPSTSEFIKSRPATFTPSSANSKDTSKRNSPSGSPRNMSPSLRPSVPIAGSVSSNKSRESKDSGRDSPKRVNFAAVTVSTPGTISTPVATDSKSDSKMSPRRIGLVSPVTAAANLAAASATQTPAADDSSSVADSAAMLGTSLPSSNRAAPLSSFLIRQKSLAGRGLRAHFGAPHLGAGNAQETTSSTPPVAASPLLLGRAAAADASASASGTSTGLGASLAQQTKSGASPSAIHLPPPTLPLGASSRSTTSVTASYRSPVMGPSSTSSSSPPTQLARDSNAGMTRHFSPLAVQRSYMPELKLNTGQTKTPTPAAPIAAATTASTAAPGSGLLVPVLAPNEAPMSYSQSGLWFVHSLDRHSVTYTVNYVARVVSSIQVSYLRKALQSLVDRHASLRTTFVEKHGIPLQVVHDIGSVKVDFATVKIIPPADSKASADGVDHNPELKAALTAQNHVPFDITAGPIFRARFFHTRDDQQTGGCWGVLHMMAHHIAVDGWSLEILVRELCLLYDYYAVGSTGNPLDPSIGLLPSGNGLSMADYAHQQRGMVNTSEGERMWAYWQRTLAKPLPLLNLQIDLKRPPVATYAGAMHHFPVPPAMMAKMKALAKAERSTLYMVLVSSFFIFLHRYTGQDDLLIGTPMACRNRAELESTVGNLVNPVVLRANLASDPSFSQLVSRIRSVVINSIMCQEFPFALIVDRLQDYRDPSRNPIFQVLFSLNQKFKATASHQTAAGAGATASPAPTGGATASPAPASGSGSSENKSSLLSMRTLDDGTDQSTSPFDLQLIMTETETELLAALQYNTSLFTPATISRMATHLTVLWESITSNPKQSISELSILPHSEWKQVVIEWNRTERQLPKEKCVHLHFEEHAKRNPTALALQDGENIKFTYAQLNARCNRLANFIRKTFGIKKGGVVGLVFDRSYHWLTSMIAVLKAGAAYVPIDPAYPDDRILYMAKDSGAKLLLTQQSVVASGVLPTVIARAEREQKGSLSMFVVDTEWDRVAKFTGNESSAGDGAPVSSKSSITNPERDLRSAVGANDLVYIVYTSGSTGRPKGVMIRHVALVSMCQWHAHEYKHTSTDRSAQMIGPGFDPVALELWPFWMVGASVHIMPDSARASPPALVRWIASQQITAALFATPVAESVMDEVWPAHTKLKFMTAGGDKLSRPPLRPLPWRFDNHYGPSENTIITTFFPIPMNYPGGPPIGKPVANTKVYVMDQYRVPVPIGVPGELYVGGDCLAAGYNKNPEKNRDAFVHSPFSADPQARIYKTGDMVRWLPDGNLEFCGRKDNQVKIRGFRIELGEIETLLSTHPKVARVVVQVKAKDAAQGNKLIVAYIVVAAAATAASTAIASASAATAASTGGKDSKDESAAPVGKPQVHAVSGDFVAELRAFLKDSLPEYMLPSIFIALSHLPLTPNGKVDLNGLPAPDWNAMAHEKGGSAATYTAPRDATETKLSGVWASVLNLEKVGIHDNFFELGGHSLIAARLLSAIRDEFDVELSIPQLFETPTVAGVGEHIKSLKTKGTALVMAEKNLIPEAVLAPEISIEKCDVVDTASWGNPKHVYLTGVTGFLGVHLLHSLLKKTQANVHCLIRVSRGDSAIQRIWENVKKYELLDKKTFQSVSARIVPVPGDLAQPLFGLSPAAFLELAKKVDAIFHCGAFVNSVLPYSQLKAANVAGTHEILRLATHGGKLKPVHHISTLSVIPPGRYDHAVTEVEPLISNIGLHEGYAQTKFVADQLMLRAAERKLPVTIYRPGRITGHTRTGATSVEDFMCRIVKGCIQLGLAPDLDWMLDMTPVDFCADSIVHLAMLHPLPVNNSPFKPTKTPYSVRMPVWPSNCAVFHLCNAHPMHLFQFMQWLGPDGFGYELSTVEYRKWRRALLASISKRAQKLEEKKKKSGSGTAAGGISSNDGGASAAASKLGLGGTAVAPTRRTTSKAIGGGSSRRPIGIGGAAITLNDIDGTAGAGAGDDDDGDAGGGGGKIDEPNALEPLVSALADDPAEMGSQQTMPKMDPSFTLTLLKQTGGPVCPPVTGDLLELYFQYYVSCGFLSPP